MFGDSLFEVRNVLLSGAYLDPICSSNKFKQHRNGTSFDARIIRISMCDLFVLFVIPVLSLRWRFARKASYSQCLLA